MTYEHPISMWAQERLRDDSCYTLYAMREKDMIFALAIIYAILLL